LPKYRVSVQAPAWYYDRVVVEAPDSGRAEQAVEDAIREGRYYPNWRLGAIDEHEAQAYWCEDGGDDAEVDVSDDAQTQA